MGRALGSGGGSWGAWFLILIATNSLCVLEQVSRSLGFIFLVFKICVCVGGGGSCGTNSPQFSLSSRSRVLEAGSGREDGGVVGYFLERGESSSSTET